MLGLAPIGNGFGVALVERATGDVVGLREHVFRLVREGVETRSVIRRLSLAVDVGGEARPPSLLRLERRAAIARGERRAAGLTLRQWTFTPLDIHAPAVAVVVEARVEGGARDLAIVVDSSLGDSLPDEVAEDPFLGVHVHRTADSGRTLVVRAFGEGLSSVAGDGRSVHRFRLLPGRSVLGLVAAYHPFGNAAEAAGRIARWLDRAPPLALVDEEGAAWEAWRERARLPSPLTDGEREALRELCALLRMAQSREPDEPASGYLPRGQIVASLPPGRWDIAWVRDGAYAVSALSRCGFLDEARAALEFVLRCPAGAHAHLVGRPYPVSVARQRGDGSEESDWNEDGPNVELDGLGLTLWATAELIAGGEPLSFVDRWRARLHACVATIAALVDETGLIAADSSIWETHWDNGGRRHHAYTTITAIAGLERIAPFLDDATAEHARATAALLRVALLRRLVTADGVLRPSLEGRDGLDAAVVEAFNLDVLDPRGPVALATLGAVRRGLAVPSGRGCRRRDGDGYDAREWLFIDARLALALHRAGAREEAARLCRGLRERIVDHLPPELFDPETGEPEGETPMIGYGAAALLLAAWGMR